MRKILAIAIGLVLPLSLAARGVAAPVATTRPTASPASSWQPRVILPATTDPQIDAFSGDGWDHYVYYNPNAVRKGQLLVFIPGTNGKGSGAKAFLTVAADDGYHVVSLAYPSTISISTLHASTDPDAFLRARENVIYGAPAYETLKVSRANSIENRLIKLLAHLDRTYPAEGWGQYLDPKRAIRWDRLVVAGQSQGGGNAPLIAKQHRVARVLMFGAPKDFNVHFDRPAKWYADPSATPLDRFFSFVHADDETNGCTYAQQLENYRALGLMPKYAVVNVDGSAPPYDHSRLLTSKLPNPKPHGAPINDPVYTPPGGTCWTSRSTATNEGAGIHPIGR